MSVGTVRLSGRYRLLDVLGAGGMAVVHRARDELLERDVAVKVLRSQFAADEDFVHRFRQEARNAASLSHPAIAQVFDTGADGDVEYIVMQLVEGSDLERVIAQRGRLPVAEALRISSDVADALQAAHDQGIVHRDVKPGNILLTGGGDVRVVDFGIARALGAANTTSPGLLMGSVHYLSPEQVLGEPVGSASDVYSLGIVLYELLTGQRPFEGASQAAVALQRLHAAPRPPSELVEELPDGLDELVMRALERDPDRRYPTAGGLATAIRAWWKTPAAHPRKPVRRAAATAAVGAGAGVVEPVKAAPLPAAATDPTVVTRIPAARRRRAAVTAAAAAAAAPAAAGAAAAGAAAALASETATVVQPSPVVTPPAPVGVPPTARDTAAPPPGPPPPTALGNARDDGERRRRAALVLIPLAALLIAFVVLSALGRSLFGADGAVLGATASPAAVPSAAAVVPATASPSPTPSPVPSPTPSPTPEPTTPPTPEPTAPPTAKPTPRPAPARTPAPTVRPAPALPARDPAETVARFYYLVEAHDFDAAARLWTARMRRQYPPNGYIDGRFSRTTRIDLRRNEIVAMSARAGTAVVAVDLIEYRTVEPSPRRFIGRWDLVLVNGQWLMDRPHF